MKSTKNLAVFLHIRHRRDRSRQFPLLSDWHKGSTQSLSNHWTNKKTSGIKTCHSDVSLSLDDEKLRDQRQSQSWLWLERGWQDGKWASVFFALMSGKKRVLVKRRCTSTVDGSLKMGKMSVWCELLVYYCSNLVDLERECPMFSRVNIIWFFIIRVWKQNIRKETFFGKSGMTLIFSLILSTSLIVGFYHAVRWWNTQKSTRYTCDTFTWPLSFSHLMVGETKVINLLTLSLYSLIASYLTPHYNKGNQRAKESFLWEAKRTIVVWSRTQETRNRKGFRHPNSSLGSDELTLIHRTTKSKSALTNSCPKMMSLRMN